MKKTRYYHISQYHEYLENLKRRKLSFEVSITNYSRKIKLPSSTILFNNDGDRDFNLLKLINKVRRDAHKFLEEPENNKFGDSYIYYSDLIGRPKSNEIICKIDVDAAYWRNAELRGIVTEDTCNTLVVDYEGYEYKELKRARLKALGSLATTKQTVDYKDGLRIKGSETIETQITKPLYLDICRNIDMFMRDCAEQIEDCYYYYWDCIFASAKVKDEVIRFMKERNYSCKVSYTKIEIYNIGEKAYIVSEADGKVYAIRKENKHLLETHL